MAEPNARQNMQGVCTGPGATLPTAAMIARDPESVTSSLSNVAGNFQENKGDVHTHKRQWEEEGTYVLHSAGIHYSKATEFLRARER